jgi:hypothetical protein
MWFFPRGRVAPLLTPSIISSAPLALPPALKGWVMGDFGHLQHAGLLMQCVIHCA